MNEITELQKLSALLSADPQDLELSFREESSRDIRYTLVVATDDSKVLRRLASVFGCPEGQLPCECSDVFEGADQWHGRGQVNLRDLADEFVATRGEFFDFDITVEELHSLASKTTPLLEEGRCKTP